MSFESLHLSEPILRILNKKGYENPTPIQAQAIPAVLEGKDILGTARTGTGKTAAFALPILQRLSETSHRPRSKEPVALVLAPTRELAVQIDQSFRAYGQNLQIRTGIVYGGVSYGPQIMGLQKGVHVLVATPGRLFDLLERNAVRLGSVQTLVLDEADRMLDMGFLPAIRRVLGQIPQSAQKLLFSATLAPAIRELASSMLHDPISIAVAPEKTSVAQIEQHAFFVERENKRALLLHLMQDVSVQRTVVFTRTKHGADKISDFLNKSDVFATSIHGNKSQSQRERALRAFKTGKARVLVATDVASRGIDVTGVTHVINFDLPTEPESYVHRIGRTGRAEASGIAWSLCDRDERSLLAAIERETKAPLTVDEEHPFVPTFGRLVARERSAQKPRFGGKKWGHKNKRFDTRGGEHASHGYRKPSRRAHGEHTHTKPRQPHT